MCMPGILYSGSALFCTMTFRLGICYTLYTLICSTVNCLFKRSARIKLDVSEFSNMQVKVMVRKLKAVSAWLLYVFNKYFQINVQVLWFLMVAWV